MILNGRPFNPGELRTEITLQTATITQDAGGAQKPTWSELATVFCRWTPDDGSEILNAQAVQAQKPAKVLIRYRADVTPKISIVKGSERYQVYSVADFLDRHEWMELKVVLVEGSI